VFVVTFYLLMGDRYSSGRESVNFDGVLWGESSGRLSERPAESSVGDGIADSCITFAESEDSLG